MLVCSAGAHVPARLLASLCLFLRTPMSCHTDQHITVDSVPMVQRRGSDGAVQCWCGDSAVLYTVSGLHPRASHTQCCHACSSIAHRGLPRTETYHHIPIAGHYRAEHRAQYCEASRGNTEHHTEHRTKHCIAGQADEGIAGHRVCIV